MQSLCPYFIAFPRISLNNFSWMDSKSIFCQRDLMNFACPFFDMLCSGVLPLLFFVRQQSSTDCISSIIKSKTSLKPGAVHKLRGPIFDLFWPPTYLSWTFVDIWCTTYPLSTWTYKNLTTYLPNYVQYVHSFTAFTFNISIWVSSQD